MISKIPTGSTELKIYTLRIIQGDQDPMHQICTYGNVSYQVNTKELFMCYHKKILEG